MGNCLSGEDVKTISTYYHDDGEIELKSEIYVPQYTSFFNTLRKTSDLVVLQPSLAVDKVLLTNTLSIDFQTATPNSLKMLLSFKKIVLIGDFATLKETVVKSIKASTSPSRFYVVSENFCHSFLKDYPIFTIERWERDQLVTSKIPIFVMDSKEFVNASEPRFKIFIHSVTKKDQKIYDLMGVRADGVINQPPQGTTEQTNVYYLNALKKAKGGAIVLLHPPKMNPNEIIEVIASFMVEKYKIPIIYAQLYLRRSLPSVGAPTALVAQPTEIKTSGVIISSIDKFKALFQKLQQQSSSEKTERAYNLLCTLVINIYSNPDTEDSYRKIKRTNKQMNDLLWKHKSGQKLLDELGFQQEGENWVNKMESKYLKIYKTDFDVAFKQFKSGVES